MVVTRQAAAVLSGAVVCLVLGWGQDAGGQGRSGDPERGLKLAQQFCSNCHIVASGGSATAIAGVPAFAAIASKPEQTVERLTGKMMAPHPPMPAIALTVEEMRDLAAYIFSVKESN